ncbi:NYN domain-containing protein [Mycena vitilis]|nr:NYN domain-containing protein [Mycena vitilis]
MNYLATTWQSFLDAHWRYSPFDRKISADCTCWNTRVQPLHSTATTLLRGLHSDCTLVSRFGWHQASARLPFYHHPSATLEMQSHSVESSDVAIFWDYENVHASSQVSGYEIASGIRNVAHRFGSVKHFKAYMEVPDPDTFRSLTLRSELQSSGVSLTDCPHNGRKNVADQMIMVDMLAYAMDHPAPATLILISGDRDFAYAVSILRLRKYEVVVMSLPMPGPHISLKSQASVYLDWNVHVMHNSSSSLHFDGTAESPAASRTSPSCGHGRKRNSGDRETLLSAYNELLSGPKTGRQPLAHEPFTQDVDVRCVPAPAYSSPGIEENICQPPVQSTSNSLFPCCSSTAVLGPDPIELLSERGSSAESPVPMQAAQSLMSVTHSDVHVLHPDPDLPTVQPDSAPVEENGSRNVPSVFQPLVDVLEKHRVKGITRPLRSAVGADLVSLAETVYKRTGATNFGQLAALAEQQKIVQLGGSNGNAWISFHRDWSTGFPENAASQTRIPAALRVLVDVLEKHSAKGITRPHRSTVGFELAGLAKTVYKQAGLTTFSQLAALGEKEGIVQLGGTDGNAWISLRRD